VVIVDTNILVDVLADDPQWMEWSAGRLREQGRIHELVINQVIYAELATMFDSVEKLDGVLADMEIGVREIPRPALFLAGKAFVKYRKGGGSKSGVLADFFVGAHAAVSGFTILTRDPRRYKNYFPTVGLISP
jgi:hypothetical protein